MKKILLILLLFPILIFGQTTPTMRQVASAGTSITRLPVASTTTVATTDTVLVFKGAVWVKTTASAIAALATSYTMAIANKITNGTAGSVLFVGTNGLLQQKNTKFFYDSTNISLGIGTATPTANLHIVSTNSTVGTYAIEIDDNGGNPLLYVRNQGQITVGQNGGDGNLFMGYESGINNTLGVGYYNTAFGRYALRANTTGYENTVGGRNAMQTSTTGHRNTVYGLDAMSSGTTANDNTAIGHSCMKAITTGSDNVGVGFQTFLRLTTGVSNTAINLGALEHLVNGNYNTAIGEQSGDADVSGGQNVFMGWQSGFSVLGSNNCIIGSRSGTTTTGSGNTFLGNMAGFYSTGSNRLIIDNDSRASEANELTQSLIYGTFDASVANQQVTVNGTLNIGSAQTAAGAVTFSQPLSGTSYKSVIIYFANETGAQSYTFPVPFTNKPSVVATNDVAAGIVTALSTTAVTVIGAATTGSIMLIGY